MSTILIVCSPIDEPTRYAYAYWKRYALYAASLGHKIIFLRNVDLPLFEQTIIKYNPSLVILNGHGGRKGVEINKHVILGVSDYDPELGLKIYGSNTHLMAGRLVYLATCNTGKELAFRLIDSGAIAVAAFKEPFIFLSQEAVSNPLNDETAKPYFISLMQLPIHLAEGKTFGESARITRKAFQYYRDLAEQNGDELAAKYFHYDGINLIVLGDTWAKLWNGGKPSSLQFQPPLPQA